MQDWIPVVVDVALGASALHLARKLALAIDVLTSRVDRHETRLERLEKGGG